MTGTVAEFSKDIWNGAVETASVIAEGTAALASGDASIKEFAADVGKGAVDQVSQVVNKNANRISTQVEGGASWTQATLSTASMMVGDAVGYTAVAESFHGTDLETGRELTTVERTSRALTGSGQIALSGVALKGSFNPNATFKGSVEQFVEKVQTNPIVENLKNIGKSADKAESNNITSFADLMSPEDADQYLKFWTKRAPEVNTPYQTHTRYTNNGQIKQFTTYDEHGFRHRQYDIIDERGKPEHFHDFTVSNQDYRGRRGETHIPIEEDK